MLSLTGCPPGQPVLSSGDVGNFSRITIEDTTYSNPDQALKARQAIYDGWLAGLTKDADRVAGHLLVVLPDYDRLRPLVAQHWRQQFKRDVTGAALDFLIRSEQQSLHAAADSLTRTEAFDKVTVVERNDTMNPELSGADYLLWYQVRTTLPDNAGLWFGRWLVRRAGKQATAGARFDPGTAVGAPRFRSFVKSVHNAALRLDKSSPNDATAAGDLGQADEQSASGSGSGFVVDKRGYILTNAHVVHGCSDLQVISTSDKRLPAKPVAEDEDNDLAVLKAEHRWSAAATFRDGSQARPGESVVVIGYPLGDLLGSSAVVTTGSLTATVGLRGDARLLQISAPIQLGNSGGPLLDSNGDAIGIISGTINSTMIGLLTGVVPQNINFAIKAEIARGFLDRHKIAYGHSSARREVSAADIGEAARQYTVRVLCLR